MGEFPQRFGNYLLLDRINAGGMAEIFRAKTFGVLGFEKIVAIKRMLPDHAADDEFVSMFLDEARIAVQLNNAHIAQILELGAVDGQYYIAMEYVEGRDIRQLLRDLGGNTKQLGPARAAFISAGICVGLDYAHRARDPSGEPLNVVHRDVTPHNVLLGFDGEVKIADFGIAKAKHRSTKTQAGLIKGKFWYLWPEQLAGFEVDRRADVYAAGLVLFELLTGRRMYTGNGYVEVSHQIRTGNILRPTDVDPDIPTALEDIVLKAVSIDPTDRYQWASEMVDDLQGYLIESKTVINERHLAAYMHQLYGQRIASERRYTQQLLALEPDEETPVEAQRHTTVISRSPTLGVALTDVNPEDLDSISVEMLDETTTDRDAAVAVGVGEEETVLDERAPDPTTKRARPALWASVLGLALLVLGLGMWLRSDPSESPSDAGVPVVVPVATVENDGSEPAAEEELEEPADEFETSTAENLKTPCDPTRKLRAVDAAMRKRGLLPGDSRGLDDARKKAEAHASGGRDAQACSAAQRALSIVRKTAVNERFVMDKMRRFNSRWSAARNPPSADRLRELAAGISKALDRGNPKEANRLLNRAFALLGS